VEERATSKRRTTECRTPVRRVRAREESNLTARRALQCEECKAARVDEALLNPLLSRLQRDQITRLCTQASGAEWLKERTRNTRNRRKECRSIAGGHRCWLRVTRCARATGRECATRCGAGGGDEERKEYACVTEYACVPDAGLIRHFSVPPELRRVVLAEGCSSPTTRGGDQRQSSH
jgi:hypothetical protein